MLAHERPPVEPAKTLCVVPPLVRRLMDDMHPHPAFVLNLRWDVLAFNKAADAVFHFGDHDPALRNMLCLLFTDPHLQARFVNWHQQAPLMLASFRRDFARATQDGDMVALVNELKLASTDFRHWWQQHDVDAPCTGVRKLLVGDTVVPYEHTSLIIDEDRHLRLVIYAEQLNTTSDAD